MVKKNQKQIPASLQPWINARRRFHLSHEHVQMARAWDKPKEAREAGQEPWKRPLPEFIRKLYSKRFGKERPDAVRSTEDIVVAKQLKKQTKKAARDYERSMVGLAAPTPVRRTPVPSPHTSGAEAPSYRAAENPHRPGKIGITVRPACPGPLPRARQPPRGRAPPR
jgi:hypothetical protein